MVPKTFAGQFIERNCACVRDGGVEAIAIEHLETVRFPAPPFSHVAQKPDWYVRQAQIEIYQIGRASTVNIAPLDHHPPVAPLLFRDRIDLQGFNKRRGGVGETVRNEALQQRQPVPIFSSRHSLISFALHLYRGFAVRTNC